jgi:hypothetical protein
VGGAGRAVKDATPDPLGATRGEPRADKVRTMAENRVAEWLRDPTFETPSTDYFEVRMPWVSFAVTREAAERILEAIVGLDRQEWVRAETVAGSVVHIRTEHVVFVREWTAAQRAAEERYWQEMEKERQELQESGESGESEEPEEGEDLTPAEIARRAEEAAVAGGWTQPGASADGEESMGFAIRWIVTVLVWIVLMSLL